MRIEWRTRDTQYVARRLLQDPNLPPRRVPPPHALGTGPVVVRVEANPQKALRGRCASGLAFLPGQGSVALVAEWTGTRHCWYYLYAQAGEYSYKLARRRRGEHKRRPLRRRHADTKSRRDTRGGPCMLRPDHIDCQQQPCGCTSSSSSQPSRYIDVARGGGTQPEERASTALRRGALGDASG